MYVFALKFQCYEIKGVTRSKPMSSFLKMSDDIYSIPSDGKIWAPQEQFNRRQNCDQVTIQCIQSSNKYQSHVKLSTNGKPHASTHIQVYMYIVYQLI